MSYNTKHDPKALLERLQALETENAKLKDASIQSPPSLVVVETEYKGHPMLEFRRANARPFSMGVKKLEVIQQGWSKVEDFLNKYRDNKDSDQI